MSETADHPPPRENMWLNLGCNLLLPGAILIKGGDILGTSPALTLVIAIAFPVGYFFYDLFKRKRRNTLSIIGFVSILLTGGIGLLKLPPSMLALKEALVPLAIGLAVLATVKTKNPLVKLFIYNPELIDTAKVDRALDTEEKRKSFDKLIEQATWLMALSFLIAAIINYVVAVLIVTTDPSVSEAAEAAYNEEIGTMLWVTPVVTSIASIPIFLYAMVKLFSGIHKLTGYDLEDLLHGANPQEKEKDTNRDDA